MTTLTELPLELILHITSFLETDLQDFKNFLLSSVKIQNLLKDSYCIVTNDINYKTSFKDLGFTKESPFYVSNLLVSNDWIYTKAGRDLSIDDYEDAVYKDDSFLKNFRGTIFLDFHSNEEINMLSDSIKKLVDLVRDIPPERVTFRYSWYEDPNVLLQDQKPDVSTSEFADRVLINVTHSSLDNYLQTMVEECDLRLKFNNHYEAPEYLKTGPICSFFDLLYTSKKRKRSYTELP
ncbi:hypothetical protein BN7_6451 [Wickerhamomyces ciferrii]|uniref:Uncharacterized protein n=1 Tax=Wickerhamomyces ciferrii (strain ATCC 14091 / BCRC 22168 / CBS 111 / JCM 3599 / NBRC 0793 / NRRL Y-1031 F-60-10) TaxID=1206466 RepID=K0KNL8_WICCF|nr:uncharacterized protein BN7_6451 [Wickerhamomyces ciferrii]CCH46850.1 hypothetical protein BN7_6451 [Wickerhamomyces ciferrii]